ncbi:hypothetical protein F5Y05DRAFT_334938 [Hypoxylon sp. FL0543]|nr:hypothetical protein F5Y05DRAFT_334938 [Hypoxylon sp. FL0543]
MLFKAAAVSAFALICAHQAAAAPAVEPRMAQIALNAYAACNCPKNCDHHVNDSCKYYGGISDTGIILGGICYKPNSYAGSDLECLPMERIH